MKEKVIRGLEGAAGDQRSVPDGILTSIATGDRSQLSSDISSAMKKTGTYHLLAISGVHLGSAFLLGMLLSRPLAALFSGALRPKRYFVVLMSGGSMSCLFYLLITGLSPSATRAVIFIGIAVFGSVVFRESILLNTLAWSFLLIGAFSSTPQPDISLALSILACLGIWTAVLNGKRGLSGWLEVSMAAFLFTLLLVAIVFRGIPILAPLWNLWIGIPFVVFLIPLAVAGDAVSVLWSTGAHLIFSLWKALANPLVIFLHWAENLKWSYLKFNLPGSILASLTSALCIILWWRWPGCLKRRFFLLLIPAAVGLMGHWSGEMTNRHQFQLRFPGLGKADAIIMKADGMTVLVDTGPPGRLSGTPPVGRFLRREGARRIEALFLTHPHPDHAGGTRYIMRNCKLGLLVLPYTSEDLSIWREVLLDVPPGTPVRFVSPGNQIRIGNMIFKVTGLGNGDYRSGMDVNRMSALIHMSWQDLDILFTGDAPWSGVLQAIKEINGLDILKVPHHGSGVGFPPEGWEEGMAELAEFPGLISVCTAGPEGFGSHPSESVTEWFRKAGMLFLLTGRGNGVNIAYPARGIRSRLGTLLTRGIGSDRKIVIF
jgi:competence protein ComEC